MATLNGTNLFSDISGTLSIALTDNDGLAVLAKCVGAAPATAGIFQHGCLMLRTDATPALYQNTGTSALPTWAVLDTGGGPPALTDGHVFVGSALNVATDVAISGAITLLNTGVTAISAGYISDADISAVAGIQFAKLQALGAGNILVGNGLGVPTIAAMSGDATISDAGVLTVANGAITKAKLASGVSASNMVILAGTHTTVGGAATEAIVNALILGTDLVMVVMRTVGAAPVTILTAAPAAGQINVTFSADPSNDHVVTYFVFRKTT